MINHTMHHAAERRKRVLALAEALCALLEPTPTASPDDLLAEADACRMAACSRRTLGDARRRGEIVAYGRQRDRAYRRADLESWIASRRVVHEPVDDADIERRMRRLAGGR